MVTSENTQNNPQTPLSTLFGLIKRVRDDLLLRNSLFIMLTSGIGSATGYLYWVIAARTYSASDVGLVSAIISAMTLTSILSILGFGSTIVQNLPHRAAGRDWSATVNTALVAASVTSLLGGVVAVTILISSPQFGTMANNTAYLAAFLFSIPLWTASTLVDAVFTAERVTGNMLVRNLIFSILKIVLLVALIPFHIGGLGIFLSWIISAAVGVGIAFVLIRRLGRSYRFTLRGVWQQLRGINTSLIGHHFINISGAAPMYMLPLFVTVRLSAANNAYFATTWTLGAQFALISVAVSVSLFAEGSHTVGNLLKKMSKCFWILVILMTPIMIIFFIFGRSILGIFGPAYAENGWVLLLLLTFGAVPDATTSVYVSMLRVTKRLRSAAMLNTGMAFLTVVIAWVLLPVFGISGVGVAWLVAQSAGSIAAILDFAVVRRTMAALPAIVPVDLASMDGVPLVESRAL